MSVKKLLYKRKIIRQLYFARTLSSADLSLAIKKSLPFTQKLLAEMIAEGYVVGTGYAPSTGGRRPVTYSLRPDSMFIVSVALDQFVARIAIMDMQNDFVVPVEKFELPLEQNAQAIAVLTERINAAIDASAVPKARIAGLGLGLPGFVDSKRGISHTFLKISGRTIADFLSEKTGVPVFVDNDSSLIALAEHRFGAARGKRNAMVVNIGWGIGLGLILNAELFRGTNGFAGEFSHIPLYDNGRLCSCGKNGCLETETSLLVIIEKAKEGLRSGRISYLKPGMLNKYEEASEAIVSAVLQGDRFAVELFSKAGYDIGRGLAILIHILNPELIILSGRGSAAGKIWEAPIQQAINEHCIPRLAANTEVKISTLGYEAELIGSAALVMEAGEREMIKSAAREKPRKVFTGESG